MKKITVVLILTAVFLALFSCGEQESPAAYLPSIRFDNIPLQSYTVAINAKDDSAVSDGPGSELTPADIIKIYISEITFTPVSSGKIEIRNGSDKNVDFNIAFEGVYTENGEKTEYTESDLSSLPAGKYVICARVVKKTSDSHESYYMFVGIEKN